MIEEGRITRGNERKVRDGRYILYWMQQSQRVHYNHALLRASYWSLSLDLPLVVYFGLTDDYPEANLRHYRFMMEGLSHVKDDLEHLGIKFVMRKTRPDQGAIDLSNDAAITICDVGTGSGILAVCAARHLPCARVTALDISPAALAVAQANAADHGVDGRICWIESDLFRAVPGEPRFDFVLSNPPYVSEAEAETLPRDVREFEPTRALIAGKEGTEVIRSLIPQAAERLKPGGHLLMEINAALHNAVQALLEKDGRFEVGPTVKDLARLPRVVRAGRK